MSTIPTHDISPTRPWRTAILTGMASFLDAAALTASGTSISVLYAPTFGLTPTTIGLVLATQQLSFAVGAMFGGQLGDKFGRRRVLTTALVLFVLGIAVLAGAQATWMLVVGAILVGLGIGADLPVALAMANEVAPLRSKGRMVVLSQLLWVVGIAAVQFGVSLVGHMGATGGRILFGSLGVVALIVLVCRFALPESQEWRMARSVADGQESAGGEQIKFERIGQVFRKPVVFALLATALYYGAWNVGASINGKYGSYIWTTLAKGDVEVYARYSLIALPFWVAFGILFMVVVDTKHRRLFTALGTVLIILGWAPLAFFGASQPAVLSVMFLWQIGSCLAGEPLFKVWSQELIPTLLRGTSQGLSIAFARVIAAVLAFVVPTLLVAHANVVFIGSFAFAVVSGLVWLLWVPRLKKAAEIEPATGAISATLSAREAKAHTV